MVRYRLDHLNLTDPPARGQETKTFEITGEDSPLFWSFTPYELCLSQRLSFIRHKWV